MNSSWYKPRDDTDKRRSCANCGSMDHHVSACSAYKQNMKAKGYFLDDVDATDEDHEEYFRGLIMVLGASSVIWKDTSSRIALSFGMQWRTRNIPATKRHFRVSRPVEHV